MKLIYLASPYSYSSPDEALVAKVKHERAQAAARATAWLIRALPNANVFSPIVHSHILHVAAGLRGDWYFWKRIDTDYLERCERVAVLTLPGWDISTGVTEERKIAARLKNIEHVDFLIPIRYDDYCLSVNAPDKLVYVCPQLRDFPYPSPK